MDNRSTADKRASSPTVSRSLLTCPNWNSVGVAWLSEHLRRCPALPPCMQCGSRQGRVYSWLVIQNENRRKQRHEPGNVVGTVHSDSRCAMTAGPGAPASEPALGFRGQLTYSEGENNHMVRLQGLASDPLVTF